MDLKNNKRDYSVSLFKGITGAVPLIGPAVAEIIGQLIPDQRLDRIETFLKKLESKIKEIDKSLIEDRFKKEPFIDLFEDGMYQASRALSEERKDLLANFFKNSISEDRIEWIRKKKILSILGELNDVEILMLQMHSLYAIEQREFVKKHEKVLRPPVVVMGSSQDDVDAGAAHKTYKNKLVQLDLISLNFRKPKKGEIPEFDDKTGMVKAQGYTITSLGRLLLKEIDLLSE